MNNALTAKPSPKNAYAAPQLKVYEVMQKLTASGMSGNSESERPGACFFFPNGTTCMSRKP